jgi:hypothetical protein
MIKRNKERAANLGEAVILVDGLNSINLLYMLPIIRGLAKNRGITSVFFYMKHVESTEAVLFERIMSGLDTKILRRKNISLGLIDYRLYFCRISYLLYRCLFVRRKDLLEKTRDFRYYLNHAIWDLAFSLSVDGELTPGITARLRAFARLKKIEFVSIFMRRFSTDSVVFLGHNVYERRLLVTRMQQLQFTVFFHAGYCVARQDSDHDRLPIIPSKLLMELGRAVVKDSITEDFWIRRQQGETINTSTIEALSIKSNRSLLKSFDSVIFLPVFRDSPFALIDPNRVFSDYIDWLKFTLQVLHGSDQSVLLKPHPSRRRWGEDSQKFIDKIFRELNLEQARASIEYSEKSIEYHQIFKSVRKVITFRGTVHLEAACHGIKPIVVSDCLLTQTSNDLAFKPLSIHAYEHLLRDTNDGNFKLSDEQSKRARRLFFYREELIPFIRDVDGTLFLRGDSAALKKEVKDRIVKRLPDIEAPLEDLGKRLGQGLEQTCSLKYLGDLNTLTQRD